jgi:hypothetical protein
LEFVSPKGLRLSYWFAGGEVITSKSWIYRGRRRHDIWIRFDDGLEWHTGSLLGVDVTRGQRLAFAFCAPTGSRENELVAVKNCATGESRVLTQEIGQWFDKHHYGLQAAIASLALAAVLWFGGFMELLPAFANMHPVVSLASLVTGASLVGCYFSCTANPDAEGEIDRNIQIGLEGMYQAWHKLNSESKAKDRNRSRRSTFRGGQGLAS